MFTLFHGSKLQNSQIQFLSDDPVCLENTSCPRKHFDESPSDRKKNIYIQTLDIGYRYHLTWIVESREVAKYEKDTASEYSVELLIGTNRGSEREKECT